MMDGGTAVAADSASRSGTIPAERPRAAAKLKEEGIVAAALRLAARVGFDKLSMRGLAEELDVTPMAIYYHVQNKKALLELVADNILSEIRIPSRDVGEWDARLRQLTAETARILAPYPGVDAMMIDLGLTIQGRRLMDGYIQILLDAGLERRDALLAYNLLHSYGVGRVTIETRLRGRPRPAPGSTEGFAALDEIREQVSGLGAADYRSFALDTIVAGLRSLLDSRSQA